MTDTKLPSIPDNAETRPDAEFQRLLGLTHWMYGLQAVGLGLALLSAAVALHPSPAIPWGFRVGAALAGWPALIAIWFHRRNKRAALSNPLLASHFDALNTTFYSCLIWWGAMQGLYFIIVGAVLFPGALFLIGLFGTFRSGYGWVMLNHGKPIRRKLRR